MVSVYSPDGSSFLVSRIPLFHNSLKSLLFRISALLLQIMFTKLMGYIACKMGSYTSFVMFAEGIMQKFAYLRSRQWKKESLLVLWFAILIPLSGLWDTLLWSLDVPGYVVHSSTTGAPSLASRLATSPSYLIPLTHRSKDPHKLNLNEAFTSNLYQPGLNISFPGIKYIGKRTVADPAQSFADAGPRIWLDDEGFSLSIDQDVMLAAGGNSTSCKINNSANVRSWNCLVDNGGAMEYARWPAGQPYVWWDSAHWWNLGPERKDNPWLSCGAGSDTAAMKQVFTVTKQNKRHTFLETVFKATLFALPEQADFDRGEVLDLVARTEGLAGPDPGGLLDTSSIADSLMAAQSKGLTLTAGDMWQNQHSVASRYNEFLTLNNPTTGARIYSLVRVITTNITLIRSEVLNAEVQPSITCDRYSQDIATGGQTRYNTCYKSFGDQGGAQFLGRLDTSSVVIFNDVLGDGTSNKSAVALNQTSFDWFKANNDRFDQMLVSRALILGGDASVVPVAIETAMPAVSYLQLALIALPIVFAAVVWPLSAQDKTGFYRSSFFTAVCTTTHITETPNNDDICTKIDQMKNPPDIQIEQVGSHMVLRTPDGGQLVNSSDCLTFPKSPTTFSGLESKNYSQAPLLLDHKHYNGLPQV